MNAYRKMTIAGAFIASLVLCAWLPAQNENHNGEPECGPRVVDLIAGQHLPVGTVTVTNDSDSICVTYALDGWAVDDGWLIYEIHLAIGAELADIPQTRGNRWGTNPIPGRFPYAEHFYRGVEEYTLCVPLEELGVEMDDVVYIAAHAVVMIVDGHYQEETAWGQGDRFNIRGNWGMYLRYRICELETAISFSGYIGYEDRPTLDFDYNDFGMDVHITETYNGDCLTKIVMEFYARVNGAADPHDIWVKRPLHGDYTYTVERKNTAIGPEVEEETEKEGDGAFEVVLFDTTRWNGMAGSGQPNVTLDEWVKVTITMDNNNKENLIHDHSFDSLSYDDPDHGELRRWDLEDLFNEGVSDTLLLSSYNPAMFNRRQGIWRYFNLHCWTAACAPICDPDDQFLVPFIIVVPVLVGPDGDGWTVPYEKEPITDCYPAFYHYYKTQDIQYFDWWETCTHDQ